MRGMPLPPFEDLLSPTYIDGISALPMEEVRARRAACQDAETELSYLRRLIQGRLDIVQADLDRRAGGHPGDLARLVQDLPGILGSETRSPDSGRLPSMNAPTGGSALTADLDAVLPPARLAALTDLPDEDVREIAVRLAGLEREVSQHRRALHERIDTFQEEIVRRYRSGEASVDSLLR